MMYCNFVIFWHFLTLNSNAITMGNNRSIRIRRFITERLSENLLSSRLSGIKIRGTESTIAI